MLSPAAHVRLLRLAVYCVYYADMDVLHASVQLRCRACKQEMLTCCCPVVQAEVPHCSSAMPRLCHVGCSQAAELQLITCSWQASPLLCAMQ